jgi:hypothetical protein
MAIFLLNCVAAGINSRRFNIASAEFVLIWPSIFLWQNGRGTAVADIHI